MVWYERRNGFVFAIPVEQLSELARRKGHRDNRNRRDFPAGQQVSNLVYRLGDRSARLADFELALDLDESDVGGVQTGGEDCCDVKRS